MRLSSLLRAANGLAFRRALTTLRVLAAFWARRALADTDMRAAAALARRERSDLESFAAGALRARDL